MAGLCRDRGAENMPPWEFESPLSESATFLFGGIPIADPTNLAYATVSSDVIIPIVDKLQTVLIGEDFEAAVIAVMMLAIVMQRQDLEPDTVQCIMDDWSKSLHSLFALHDLTTPVGKDLRLN